MVGPVDQLSEDSVKVSRVLHAGYIFECDETKIAFDPIFENPFSRNCFAFPGATFNRVAIRALRFSAIFISHFHDDHFSLESLNLIDRATPIYLYSIHDEMFDLLKQLGFSDLHRLHVGLSVIVGSMKITPHLALDPDVDSIFQVQAGGVNVLNVVDAWIDPATIDHLARETWDLILWPFQTLRELAVLSPFRAEPAERVIPSEWLDQLKQLNPRSVVPSSCQFIHEEWSWFNRSLFPISYRSFQQDVGKTLPHILVRRMNPGESISITRDSIDYSSPLEWVLPEGPQDVDYDFAETPEIPSTAEVAKHLTKLDAQRMERAVTYCRDQLILRYRSLRAVEYFEKPRIWKLSLYDQDGRATDFLYRIERENIQVIGSLRANDLISWQTEIAFSKLLAALEEGESLTSLYIRINDSKFKPEIELDLDSTELTKDPLVRCLFEGKVASYQLAQMRRLVGDGMTSDYPAGQSL